MTFRDSLNHVSRNRVRTGNTIAGLVEPAQGYDMIPWVITWIGLP